MLPPQVPSNSSLNASNIHYYRAKATHERRCFQEDLNALGLVFDREREDLWKEGVELRREIEALLSETSGTQFSDGSGTNAIGVTETPPSRGYPAPISGASSSTNIEINTIGTQRGTTIGGLEFG
jgi:hypothetical protein